MLCFGRYFVARYLPYNHNFYQGCLVSLFIIIVIWYPIKKLKCIDLFLFSQLLRGAVTSPLFLVFQFRSKCHFLKAKIIGNFVAPLTSKKSSNMKKMLLDRKIHYIFSNYVPLKVSTYRVLVFWKTFGVDVSNRNR